MKSLLLMFLICTTTALALPSRAIAEVADDAETATADGSKEANAELASWVKKLDGAKLRLEVAQQELDKLTNAKGRGATRRYPRGDAKAKYLDSLKQTRAEYEDARRALPDLVEEARRAGIALGVLEPYEAAAEAASPAANADDAATDTEATDIEAVDTEAADTESAEDAPKADSASE